MDDMYEPIPGTHDFCQNHAKESFPPRGPINVDPVVYPPIPPHYPIANQLPGGVSKAIPGTVDFFAARDQHLAAGYKFEFIPRSDQSFVNARPVDASNEYKIPYGRNLSAIDVLKDLVKIPPAFNPLNKSKRTDGSIILKMNSHSSAQIS